MELHIPSYYPQFHCLADRCPHTCCAWWEVPVDPESAAFYRTAPGPLGDALRAALTRDEDGEPCLRLTGGKCPLLDERGLCSLQLTWGEERLPAICREHPRFSYDYGGVRELGLCASCPEAARLVLEREFSLTVENTPEKPGGTDPLLFPLLNARASALALLRADAPLPRRLQALLLLGNDLQNLLDEGGDEFEPVCQAYAERFPLLTLSSLSARREALTSALGCLKELELLQADWACLLDAALSRLDAGEEPALPPEREGGYAAAYFLYRHWLRALNDGDLLTWCELAVLGTVVSGILAPLVGGGFPEAFRRFCLEIEHSQPNLDALQDALWHKLSLAQLLLLPADA